MHVYPRQCVCCRLPLNRAFFIQQSSIRRIIKDLMAAATCKAAPQGVAHSPQSRALYGVDVALAWETNQRGIGASDAVLALCLLTKTKPGLDIRSCNSRKHQIRAHKMLHTGNYFNVIDTLQERSWCSR